MKKTGKPQLQFITLDFTGSTTTFCRNKQNKDTVCEKLEELNTGDRKTRLSF
jgi:hypothetical protein